MATCRPPRELVCLFVIWAGTLSADCVVCVCVCLNYSQPYVVVCLLPPSPPQLMSTDVSNLLAFMNPNTPSTMKPVALRSDTPLMITYNRVWPFDIKCVSASYGYTLDVLLRCHSTTWRNHALARSNIHSRWKQGTQKEKEEKEKEEEEIRDWCVVHRRECEPIIVGSWIMLSLMQGKGIMPFFWRVVINMFWRKNAFLGGMSPRKKRILSWGCYVMW